MKTHTEFQPYINKELNQPRHCVWLTPECVSEYQLLQIISNSIQSSEKIKVGFTGVEKDVLLIIFPFTV